MANPTENCRRANRARRGTAAVEFAIVLPILITIVLACIDFGRFASTYIAVTNAARVGAGFGSLNPVTSVTWADWEQSILAVVAAEMGEGYDPAKISVAPPVVTDEGDGHKRVRVEVSYPFETQVAWPLLPNTMTLTQAVEMRVIR